MHLVGPYPAAAGVSRFRGGGGHVDSFRRGEYRHRGIERRAESRVRRRCAYGLVPASAAEIRHVAPDHQYGGGGQIMTIVVEPRRRYVSGELVRVWRDLEFCAEGRGRPGAALYASAGSRISRAVEFHDRWEGNSCRAGIDHADAAGDRGREFVHQTGCDDCRRGIYGVAVHDI